MHFSGLTGSCYHQWAKWKTSGGFTRNESTTISLSLLSRRPIYFGHFSNLSLVHDLVLDLLVCHDHQVDCLWEGTPIEGNDESDGVGKLGSLGLMVYWQLCSHDVLIRNAFPAPKSKSFSDCDIFRALRNIFLETCAAHGAILEKWKAFLQSFHFC